MRIFRAFRHFSAERYLYIYTSVALLGIKWVTMMTRKRGKNMTTVYIDRYGVKHIAPYSFNHHKKQRNEHISERKEVYAHDKQAIPYTKKNHHR